MCSHTRPRFTLSSEAVGRQPRLKHGLRHLYLVRTEWVTHPSTDRGRRCLTCYKLEGDLQTELQRFLKPGQWLMKMQIILSERVADSVSGYRKTHSKSSQLQKLFGRANPAKSSRANPVFSPLL